MARRSRRSRRSSRRSASGRRSKRSSRRSSRRSSKRRGSRRARRGPGRRRSGRKVRRHARKRRGAKGRRRRSYARRSNPRRKRHRARRGRGARGRRRSSKRSGGRRRSSRTRRRSNPSGLVRTVTGGLRSLTRGSTAKTTVVSGIQIGLGFAGVNALRAIEGRFFLDGIMSRLPGGIASRVGEYVVKFLNTGVATWLAQKVGKKTFATHVRAGGFANIGVNLLADVAGLFGGAGDTVRSYLHGMGDYNLAYNQGQAMGGPFTMGNYNLANGGQAINSVSGAEVYPDFDSVY